jgi:hypothetical protein
VLPSFSRCVRATPGRWSKCVGESRQIPLLSAFWYPCLPLPFSNPWILPYRGSKNKALLVGPPEAMATRTRGKHCARTHTIDVYDTLIEPTRSPCFESRSHPLFESLGAHLQRLWRGWFEWAAALRAARVSE